MFKSQANPKLFDELRDLVTDLDLNEYHRSDGYLLRWLQYTNYNPLKAALGLRKSQDWQRVNKIERIGFDDDFGDLMKRFPIDFEIGRNGRLVMKIFVENMDIKGFDCNVDHHDRKRLMRFAYWIQIQVEDRIKAQYYNNGRTFSQCLAIVDCTGMTEKLMEAGFRNVYRGLSTVQELASVLETNFPRGIQITCVINAPKLFSVFFTAIKPFFCAETIQAFQIHRSGSGFDWRGELCC